MGACASATIACILGIAPAGLADAGTEKDAPKSAEEMQAALDKELAEIRVVRTINDQNMHKWAYYCFTIDEVLTELRKAKKSGRPSKEAIRGARRKGNTKEDVTRAFSMLLPTMPTAESIEIECDRLGTQFLPAITKKNTDTKRAVEAWVKRAPDLGDTDSYWTEWHDLDRYLRVASRKGHPGHEKMAKLKARLDAAWAAGHDEIRRLVAKELYVTLLRNMISVDRVAAAGKNGSLLQIERTHCHGSFTSILMSQYEEIFERGQFAKVRCVPRFEGGPVEIPLLEDEAPASR